MEPNLRQLYLSELTERLEDFSAVWPHFVRECEAFEKYEPPAKDTEVNRWRIRKYAAELLQTAAQVGRILDPHPTRGSAAFKRACVARGLALRTELKVPNGCPILDKDLRNALEHIDEFIDAWMEADPKRELTTWAFATVPPDQAPLQGAIRRIHVRSYDIEVLDRRANLKAISAAMQELGRNMKPVQRSDLILRIGDPKTGASDVITTRRVFGAGEKPPPPSSVDTSG